MHFNEYSHDFDEVIDDDVTDDDDKPACPYGTACYRYGIIVYDIIYTIMSSYYRKNPLHRKQYSHNAPPIAGISY